MNGAAWFWTFDPPTLWAGKSGVVYEGAREIEPVHALTLAEACEVFCRQVAPYAPALIPPGKITTIRHMQIY